MSNSVLSDLIITKIISATTMYTPQGTKVIRKKRPNWALVIKYEGETLYRANGKTFVSDINHVYLLPMGCSYQWECTRSGNYCIIEFQSDKTYHEPICFPVRHGDSILKHFKELEHKRNLRTPILELESIKDTYSIILKLEKASTEKYLPSSKRQRLERAIDYVSENFKTNIKNDTLASLCGMSTVYFRKTFTEVMGVSPITYVKQLRIEKAKEMLKSDHGSLSDIALSLGYSSLYDFSRDFKKQVGVPPSRYKDL